MDCSVESLSTLIGCGDERAALQLKLVAIATILVACFLGVSMPILGRFVTFFHPQSDLFFVVKAFAAGVILATAFVHMLPTSFESLGNPCLAQNPWGKFPFAGFVSMIATLCTLCIDFWATAYYEKKHLVVIHACPSPPITSICTSMQEFPYDDDNHNSKGKRQEISHHGSVTPIAQDVKDKVSHDSIDVALCTNVVSGHDACCSVDNKSSVDIHDENVVASSYNVEHAKLSNVVKNVDPIYPIDDHSLIKSELTTNVIDCHSHTINDSHVATQSQIRQRVISQVLELGIVSHSIIIGISLGATKSPCIVRPLLAALTFHQFFEGVALGGCIAQAGYHRLTSVLMAFFFSVTTPLGIGIGIGISSSYNENSPTALIVEGLFDSISAGILVYMSLVDLIATDFLSKRLESNLHLQVYSFIALFVGAGFMSVIAYWA